jgi:adenylate cyclase
LFRKYLEEAIALDPEYAEAYAVLSSAFLYEIWYSPADLAEQLTKRAEEMLKKAISLRGKFPDAHSRLGRIYLRKKQYDKAIAEGERAVAMAPGSAWAHAHLAYILECAGRPGEAISLYEKANRLSPISDAFNAAGVGWCYFDMGKYEEAISAFKKCLNRTPKYIPARAYLAASYIMLGREEEARAEVAEVLKLNPKFSVEARRKKSLYKNPEDVKHAYDAMLKAGLPE